MRISANREVLLALRTYFALLGLSFMLFRVTAGTKKVDPRSVCPDRRLSYGVTVAR